MGFDEEGGGSGKACSQAGSDRGIVGRMYSGESAQSSWCQSLLKAQSGWVQGARPGWRFTEDDSTCSHDVHDSLVAHPQRSPAFQLEGAKMGGKDLSTACSLSSPPVLIAGFGSTST